MFEIRDELKQRRKLGRLMNQQWTDAQRSNPQSYRPGMVIQFHQNVHGITRGRRLTVSSLSHDSCVYAQDEFGQGHTIPLNHSSRFQVYKARALPVAVGDKIRITQNGFTADGKHRLNNGDVYQVKGFTGNGDMKLDNGWVIDKKYGNLAHGYCQTSHVAQSKTVDRVFIAQSTASLGASSAEQCYVSVSRARGSVTIYTDNKARLLETIQSSSRRMTAHELLKLPIATTVVDPFESMLREKAVIPSFGKEMEQPKTNKEKEVKKKRGLWRVVSQSVDQVQRTKPEAPYRRGISH